MTADCTPPAISKVTSPSNAGEAIRVRGLVQGVGFRPAVWHIARDAALWARR
ncbi:MAG: acylphosphatase [Alphaproteobacteria bacterium]